MQSRTGIWQQGGGNADRNLLDFNEITVDDKGRALYGYSDGCVSPGCVAGTAFDDFVAYMRVARQSGGKSLFAAYDSAEPALPKRACLAGTRDASGAHLIWNAPDNGGADIRQYRIFRGTGSGKETLIGKANGFATTFDDTSTKRTVGKYYYVVRAVNAQGVGNASNEIVLSSP